MNSFEQEALNNGIISLMKALIKQVQRGDRTPTGLGWDGETLTIGFTEWSREVEEDD
jgi:hypothetical protein